MELTFGLGFYSKKFAVKKVIFYGHFGDIIIVYMKRLLVLFVFFSLLSINHSNAKGWLGIQFLPLNDAAIKGFAGEGSLEKD